MADRQTADPALDELRRKGRRRLVGAIVLALAAAVILPMLLQKEPRPLGEDVAVRVPPVDQGKFVNRLSPDAAKDTSATAPVKDPAPASPTSAASPSGPTTLAPAPSATPPVDTSSPTAAASKAETSSTSLPAAAPAPAAPASSVSTEPSTKSPEPLTSATGPERSAKSEPHPDSRVESGETKTAAKGAATPENGTKAKQGEGSYVVQLAAFSDDKGANALASKLKRSGYPAYTEPIQTSKGTLYRVRVGTYGTRQAAGDARNKLKSDGYAGIVASAH